MVWALSDGTRVTSDGKQVTVAGGSEFAQWLAHRASMGAELSVPEYPPPAGVRPLTPSSARNIDSWIRSEIWTESADVLVSTHPVLEPLPDAPARAPGDEVDY